MGLSAELLAFLPTRVRMVFMSSDCCFCWSARMDRILDLESEEEPVGLLATASGVLVLVGEVM